MLPSRFALSVVVLLMGRAVLAQEFSVYTRVFDASAGASADRSRAPVGRSLSLFHAGKAYDYVENAQDGEVIIFEPATERFRILNTTRSIWTTVHFDQLHHKLKLARNVAERRLEALADGRAAAPEPAAELAFVLHPSFQESFDAGRQTLTLASPVVTYRARCAKPDRGQPSAELVEAYLRYADALVRMNYVLHPHALGPEPRLALNAALGERRLIPVEVELKSRIGGDVHLRAEHKFRWTLEARDRSLIHEWETLMSGGQLRQVTLDEYQRILLGGPATTDR
ncbi:MAG TPA: hypothetical protein VML55_16585 [Planctomycetaceae bacterium]|nr:hypothetical protein [Planctomycetaceae bacterium]